MELHLLNSKRIERILDSGVQAVLTITGGGSSALQALLATPGASKFVADARIPYSAAALERVLGHRPQRAVSPATACALARAAIDVDGPNSSLLSVSCTAALQTDRVRRGADRAFICMKRAQTEKLFALHFSNTSRPKQEALLGDWLLVLIAQATGAERGLLLPGSFDPVHPGHRKLLRAAEKRTQLRGVFELSCANVDKPELSEEVILQRVSAIHDVPVALTHAPRFTQKADLFPQTTFVLGYDTAVRLVDPNYSVGWQEATLASPVVPAPEIAPWEFFRSQKTAFLVAGRLAPRIKPAGLPDPSPSSAGKREYYGLADISLPKGYESLFSSIPEETFREDISSTELRNA